MKKNILIIGLTGILGTFVALSSCGPDYETEFNVLTLTIPSESQAAVVFPLLPGPSPAGTGQSPWDSR